MLFGAFNPQRGATKSVTTTGSSQNVLLGTTGIPGAGTESVRITNAGATNSAFFRVFDSVNEPGTVCTSADTIVLPNSSIVVLKEKAWDTVAVLQLTGATTLWIQPGAGGV